jgi:hypothetical protein
VGYHVACWGTGLALVRCMSTMLKAGKALEQETTTTQENHSAPGIIRNAMLYRARSRGSISGEFELGKRNTPSGAGPSIWGWCREIHWTSESGFLDSPDEVPEPPPPPGDE